MTADTPAARARIEGWFPLLAQAGYRIKSETNARYNCLAWAAEKTNKWWEAADGDTFYWPPGVPDDGSAVAAVKLYESLGYVRDDAGSTVREVGVEKVAIYYDDDGYTHAALQLDNGKWT